ncbi:MAG TPA: zinc ABC transporter solute-binding protein [Bacillales bacterium]|nr:zinc ABC transporter solute-binding protein [Bacillales bacterium]
MKKKSTGLIILFLLINILMSGCSQKQNGIDQPAQGANGTLTIYTTLFPIEDFTKKIGGSHVNVKSIIPLGTNAHTYEPTTKTMIEIAEGDAFIYSSEIMEPYADKISKALKDENVKMVEASNGITMLEVGEENHEEEEHVDEHAHGDVDPHVWIDPILSIKLAENIKDSLIELKPEATEDFIANYNTLKMQLEIVNGDFDELVKGKKSPKILVSHAAFGYWEKRYGIEQISITGLSSTNEPSQQQLQKIIDNAKANKIKYIIFEQNVTPKVAEIIKNEIHAEVLRIHNLSVLTEEDIKNNEDYFTLMEKNIETLKQALE